jgi:hypothetical protein
LGYPYKKPKLYFIIRFARVGRISSSGDVKWRGSVFSKTSSRGKLAFLNNMVGLFEAEIDADGNFSEKIWEWK